MSSSSLPLFLSLWKTDFFFFHPIHEETKYEREYATLRSNRKSVHQRKQAQVSKKKKKKASPTTTAKNLNSKEKPKWERSIKNISTGDFLFKMFLFVIFLVSTTIMLLVPHRHTTTS
jgi:hypothetical protein